MEVFAFKNNYFELKNSSSGGAFIACCKSFEKKYGPKNVAFCGAELRSDMTVVHDIVYSAKDCSRFQGSKYVRSNTDNIYLKISELLLEGKAVLFSGTPCQVAALKAAIAHKKISTEKLFTIDIICHGTPDVRIWNAYKAWIEEKAGGKLIAYSFRYKPKGWYGYPAYAEFDNGIKMIDTKETSVYSKLHLRGFSITAGCFKCPYSNMKRISDVTIGDFWGIEQEQISIDDRDGVSLIIVNTRQGTDIVKGLEQEGILIPIVGTNFIKYQHNLLFPTNKPKLYDDFWKDVLSNRFEEVLHTYLSYGWKYTIKYDLRSFCEKIGLLELYRKVKRKY